jgi:hypothetical protein
MFKFLLWFASSIILLIPIGVNADESEEPLSAEFLQYLAEFSDEQGEILDPELLADLMPANQPLAEQKPAMVNTVPEAMVEEKKP